MLQYYSYSITLVTLVTGYRWILVNRCYRVHSLCIELPLVQMVVFKMVVLL